MVDLWRLAHPNVENINVALVRRPGCSKILQEESCSLLSMFVARSSSFSPRLASSLRRANCTEISVDITCNVQ